MYCVKDGRPCIMAQAIDTDAWEYIPEDKWDKMPQEERAKYRI